VRSRYIFVVLQNILLNWLTEYSWEKVSMYLCLVILSLWWRVTLS
jgi:hypothetical protein